MDMRFPERCLEKITQKASLISPGGLIRMNGTMRLLREHLNLSIQEVADATGLSFRTILRAEQGAPLKPESRRRLCRFYGKTSEELSLVPRSRNATYHQQLQEQAKKHIN
jgi:transcriptional regulator with XRE-family HTH domain